MCLQQTVFDTTSVAFKTGLTAFATVTQGPELDGVQWCMVPVLKELEGRNAEEWFCTMRCRNCRKTRLQT